MVIKVKILLKKTYEDLSSNYPYNRSPRESKESNVSASKTRDRKGKKKKKPKRK